MKTTHPIPQCLTPYPLTVVLAPNIYSIHLGEIGGKRFKARKTKGLIELENGMMFSPLMCEIC